MSEFTHFDGKGASRMVDVSGKPVTHRMARAGGLVRMAAETGQKIRELAHKKGDVLEVARLAGIMAAKRTGEWIPLCHPLSLDSVEIDYDWRDDETLAIEARAATTARTGVEMEAMVAVSAAALTIYDMCKSVDRGMVVDNVRLEEKTGGASGHFLRQT